MPDKVWFGFYMWATDIKGQGFTGQSCVQKYIKNILEMQLMNENMQQSQKMEWEIKA